MSETPKKRTAKKTDVEEQVDVEAILPSVGEIEIVINGKPVPCTVRRLKTREFLALLNVVTAGLGPSLGQVQIDFTDSDTISRDLSALMLLALPNAVDEFTVFLRGVVEPKDSRHAAVVATYLMENPDVDVMLNVFEHVAIQEKDDLAVLAGKAQAMWTRVSKVYSPK